MEELTRGNAGRSTANRSLNPRAGLSRPPASPRPQAPSRYPPRSDWLAPVHVFSFSSTCASSHRIYVGARLFDRTRRAEPLDPAFSWMCSKDSLLALIHDVMVLDAGGMRTCPRIEYPAL